MKIAITAGFFTKRNVNIDAGHCTKVVFSKLILLLCRPLRYQDSLMSNKLLLVFVGLWLFMQGLRAQNPSQPLRLPYLPPSSSVPAAPADSALLQGNVQVADSLAADARHADTLSTDTLMTADLVANASRHAGLPYYYLGFDLSEWLLRYPAGTTQHYMAGSPRVQGERWVIGILFTLLVLFSLLKRAFDKQLHLLVQAFFSKRVLSNINKEENLFTAWPFLLLFIEFGCIMGLFLYLAAQQYSQTVGRGITVFLSISAAVIVLYIFKIIVLRLVGFFFDVQKPVNEYIAILYLSYFNTSLLFIPLVIAFALSPANYAKYYVIMAFLIVLIVFIFQLIRASLTVLSQNRFSKVYLFLYFCTLEICPILVLIKAVGF